MSRKPFQLPTLPPPCSPMNACSGKQLPSLKLCFPALSLSQVVSLLRRCHNSHRSGNLFTLAVVMTFQKDLETEIPGLISQMTGIEISDKYDTLLTVIVMILAIWGISTAFDAIFHGRKHRHLDSERQRLIGVASDLVQVPADAIEEAVEAASSGQRRRAIASAAQRFFFPAKRSGKVEIRSRVPEASIRYGAVDEARSVIGVLVKEDDTSSQPASEFEFDVEIVLHATDRDRFRQGWAGHIPGVIDIRVPMRIDKTIPPESPFGRQVVRGDVLVVSDVTEEGDLKPREFVLLRLT